ncbi:MAG: type II toxin-antitoxin system death-on-curing family toxin [Phycisphaeraceae bacterium]
MSICFLDQDDAIELQKQAIESHGGLAGLRDPGMLSSAMAMPKTAFGGQFMHESIPAMAAAYAFHLVLNHPFHDGNKRVGFLVSDVFLRANGYQLDVVDDELIDLFLRLAAGEITKDYLISWYESHSQRSEERA